MNSGKPATLKRAAVVLDTNVASLAIKGKTSGFEDLLADRDLVVSFVTMGELIVWAETRKWGPRKWDEMLNWLGQVAVLDSSVEISYAWAQLFTAARHRGRPRSQNDTWIAATCMVANALLAPLNVKDFLDFAEFHDLRLAASPVSEESDRSCEDATSGDVLIDK